MTRAPYDTIGVGYSRFRQPDPRIQAQVEAALGDASRVVNVGAGPGSYEPLDRCHASVDLSMVMLAQHPGRRRVLASAEQLPFADSTFDAAMAILTIHHWPDWRAGVGEMRRVARGRVVILTWDPDHPGFWLVQDYFPEILEIDRVIVPRLAEIERVLGPCEIHPVPVPADCSDGFLGAYWRRPEMYLDTGARGAISAFARIQTLDAGLDRLRADLADGTWRRRHGSLLSLPEIDIGYRLVVA